MGPALLLIRSWLYVAPGNHSELAAAARSKADALILDLEDLTAPSEKHSAQLAAAEFIDARVGASRPLVFGRINSPSGGMTNDDLEALVRPGLDGLRLPKVESAPEVQAVDRLVGELERRRGLPASSIQLVPIIESAAGVANVFEIARSSPRITLLGFGVTDFLADIDGTEAEDGAATLYARSQLVIASRCADLAPPCDGVYLDAANPEGLRRSTQASRQLGFFGRTSIDARQVDEINALLTPTPDQVLRARRMVAEVERAEAAGIGSLLLSDGSFANVAVARRARRVLQLARSFGVVDEGMA